MVNADVLDEAGFRGAEPGNVDEVIALLEARTDIRVMVTDVKVPRFGDEFDLTRCVTEKRSLPITPRYLFSPSQRGEF